MLWLLKVGFIRLGQQWRSMAQRNLSTQAILFSRINMFVFFRGVVDSIKVSHALCFWCVFLISAWMCTGLLMFVSKNGGRLGSPYLSRVITPSGMSVLIKSPFWWTQASLFCFRFFLCSLISRITSSEENNTIRLIQYMSGEVSFCPNEYEDVCRWVTDFVRICREDTPPQ